MQGVTIPRRGWLPGQEAQPYVRLPLLQPSRDAPHFNQKVEGLLTHSIGISEGSAYDAELREDVLGLNESWSLLLGRWRDINDL